MLPRPCGCIWQFVSGTLTFPPGQTSRNVSVPITNDTLQESSETVNLTLSSPTNATLGSHTSAVRTILDDETPPPVGDELYTYVQIGNLLSKIGVGALTVACGLFSAPVSTPIPIDGRAAGR